MTKVKHRDVFNLNGLFSKYGSATGAPWFSYAVSKNMSALEPVIKAVEAAAKATEEEQAFEKDKQALLNKHAKKDAAGNPITYPVNMPGGMQSVRYEVEDIAVYNKELDAIILESYPDLEKTRTQRMAELDALMDTDVELNLVVIKASDVPQDMLSANDMTLLFKYNILEWDLKRPDSN